MWALTTTSHKNTFLVLLSTILLTDCLCYGANIDSLNTRDKRSAPEIADSIVQLTQEARQSREKIGHYEDYHDTVCANSYYYGPLNYTHTCHKFCTYRVESNCTFEEVEGCTDMPKVECDVQAFPKCQMETTTKTYKEDKIKFERFSVRKCVKVEPDYLTEWHHKPKCENITRQHCEEKWIRDEDGNKIFGGAFNCKNKTWESCHLEKEPHIITVDKYKCTNNTEVWYPVAVKEDVEVTLMTTECEAIAFPKCNYGYEKVCKKVQIKQCKDKFVPVCFGTADDVEHGVCLKKPFQEHITKKRCVKGVRGLVTDDAATEPNDSTEQTPLY